MNLYYKLRIIFLSLLVLLGTNACDDGFEELNINPTQANDLDPAFQLTRVQVTMSNNRYEYWRTQFIYSSTIVQQAACNCSYWAGDKYNRIDSYASAWWDSSYPREVKNVVDMVNRSMEDPDRVNYAAAGRILKVYIFSRLTDLYGDIPYSEAGKGFIDRVFFPKYDAQEDIYNDFFTELESAINQFDPSAPFDGDVFLGGDIDKWKRWGNSLRLRLGMRLTKVDPARAQQEVEAAIAGGVMESNDDIVFLQHTENETNGNSDVMFADDNWRWSDDFVTYLRDNNDPRLPVWGMVYDGDGNPQPDVSSWVGLPNGTDANSPEADVYETFVRHNRETIKDRTSPFFHQTYGEVEFLMAEAAIRGWNTPLSAAEHFENGLRASLDHMNLYPNTNITPEQIEEFVASQPLDESSFEASLEHISTELWVQFTLNAMEAWSNWRRTGYPELTPVDHPIGTTNGTVPRRMYYPPSEQGINPNYQEAVDRQFGGRDDLAGRVWWDVE